jgi:FKBP-type peptidyl-prolyl cis-trans isomerase FklB
MKLFLAVATAAGLVAGSALAQDRPAPKAGTPAQGGDLKDLKQKASYSYGYRLGRSLKTQGVEIDAHSLARGLFDAIGGTAALSDQEMQASLQEFAQKIQAKQAGMASKAATSNKVEGEKFLAENKTKPGVVTRPSGLQYKILKEGNGPKPKADDSVTVHYEGKLIDGTIFDSSLKRGEPVSFPVKGVIAGWTEALQLMPVGSTWQLFIPSNLAYGENPRPGGPIGPNAVLTFEVQLLKIGEEQSR